MAHQLSQMKSVIFSITSHFEGYSSESRIILRSALQLALTLGFRSATYVFKQIEASYCSTMRRVKPGLPSRLKMTDALALSSRSGSMPVATATLAWISRNLRYLTEANKSSSNFPGCFKSFQNFLSPHQIRIRKPQASLQQRGNNLSGVSSTLTTVEASSQHSPILTRNSSMDMRLAQRPSFDHRRLKEQGADKLLLHHSTQCIESKKKQ